MEEIWDRLLSKGKRLYGVASDDAHRFTREFSLDQPIPAKAWVMVRASKLSPDEITASLHDGRFYGTNGVVLENVTVTSSEYAIDIAPHKDCLFTTYFIGAGGTVLKKAAGLHPTYRFRGTEKYVRARVASSSGDFAITQPVWPH
jgi:hypothetical protein